MFAAGEGSNHIMYRFTSLGTDEEKPIQSNSTIQFKENDPTFEGLIKFCPREELSNLEVCDTIQNLGSINDMLVKDLNGCGDP